MHIDNDESEALRRAHLAEMGADDDLDLFFNWERRVVWLGRDFLRTDRDGLLSLDGDQEIDGYSLDFASDAYDAGQTPEQYIASVRAARAAIGVV